MKKALWFIINFVKRNKLLSLWLLIFVCILIWVPDVIKSYMVLTGAAVVVWSVFIGTCKGADKWSKKRK